MTKPKASKIRTAALAAASVAALTAASAQAGELTLKRAILSSGGVGYFEYEAEVAAGQTGLSLRARLDQIDDVLKSLIVMDAAGAASASLPGKAGAAQTFQSLPFGESDLASLPALMNALKGARVSVEAPRRLSGVILSATPETVKDRDGNERSMTRVALMSGVLVEQFLLEETQGLAFADAKLGAQVEAALAALSAARDKSGRDISIHLAQGEARKVRLGYVAEAPVWKAAYRLSMGGDGQGEKSKARLQGWAVIENMTGADWDGVALTLTSGSPVTFRQALYDPYFVTRPTVPPPVPKLALPRMDEGQMPIAAQRMAEEDGGALRKAKPMMAARARAEALSGAVADLAAPPPPAAPAPAPLGASAAASADASDSTLGASFALSAPVKAKAGESLSLPFLDVEAQATDSAWVQSGATGRNPWRAVRLSNAATTPWPAGSVTLYETSQAGPVFVGEAQLPTLPAGQDRLMAFGADAKVTVDRETTSKGIVSEIALSRGVLNVIRRERTTTLYRVKNDDQRPRDVVVDQPRIDGATLVTPKPEDATISGRDWRIRRSLAPGQTQAIEVTVERPLGQSVAMNDVSRAGLAGIFFPGRHFDALGRDAFAAVLSETKLDSAAIERLQKIADAAEAVASEQQKLDALARERREIFEDQDRIRANLNAVSASGDFGRSLVAKMQTQETRLAVIEADTTKSRAAQAAARKTLEDLIGRSGEPTRFKTQQTF